MGRVHIENVSSLVSKRSIHILTRNFGEVLKIEVLNENSIAVEFRSRFSSEGFLEFIKMKNSGLEATIDPQKTAVFVDRVPKETSIGDIKKAFSKFGEILNLEVERNYFTFQTLKIFYSKESEAARCVEKANRRIRFRKDDEPLIVKYYDEQTYQTISNLDQEADDRCVFIYNLPDGYTNKDLLEVFSMYGEVRSAGVSANNKAFVNYEQALSALKAVKYTDNLVLGSKKINVVIKSQKKSKKRKM